MSPARIKKENEALLVRMRSILVVGKYTKVKCRISQIQQGTNIKTNTDKHNPKRAILPEIQSRSPIHRKAINTRKMVSSSIEKSSTSHRAKLKPSFIY